MLENAKPVTIEFEKSEVGASGQWMVKENLKREIQNNPLTVVSHSYGNDHLARPTP